LIKIFYAQNIISRSISISTYNINAQEKPEGQIQLLKKCFECSMTEQQAI